MFQNDECIITKLWRDFNKNRSIHPDLIEAANEIPNFILNSKADSTVRKYKSYFKQWIVFARKYDMCPIPVEVDDFVLFLSYKAKSGASHSVLSSLLFSVKWFQRQFPGNNKSLESSTIDAILESSKRMVRKSNQKEPITMDSLREMAFLYFPNGIDEVSKKDLLLLRNITLCIIAFAGMFRFNEISNIIRENIKFHDSFVDIFVSKSKCDQFREGNHVVVAKTGSTYCPYNMLFQYCQLAEFDDAHYIFCRFTFFKKSKEYSIAEFNIPISYTRMREIFIFMCKQIKLDSSKFGLHSLRSGGTSAAAESGVPDRLIKRQGRWKSEKSKNTYIKESVSNKLLASAHVKL